MDSEPLGLVEFLADLRQDLARANAQAVVYAQAEGTAGVLWLGVEEVTVTLMVAHERTLAGEASAKVGGKFWVFASAEAAAKASGQSKSSGTQTLTLTLKPRVETTTTDRQGRSVTTSRGLDVDGQLAPGEQLPSSKP